ncbi:MAG TPA: hypothetical protein DCZ94_14175 [Lentisphaeria bacterium]|nr:MAG: hypothetical protein A2X48_10090 [Lentisphaerae bacterium GWF2_49_21]HBC88093.1 hypothetical protein [Lentisphaeria bacterium]
MKLKSLFTGFFVFGLLSQGFAAAAQDKVLIDFKQQGVESRIKDNGPDTKFAIVGGLNGNVLEVTNTPGTNGYPGVKIAPDGAVWDLSQNSRVEADITNLSDTNITICLRVDNPGDWQTNPWNGENLSLAAGKSGTAKVNFGYSWGNPGFKLDPSKVSMVMLFTTKPKKEIKFRVDAIRAAGKAGEKPKGSIEKVKPKDGVILEFTKGFSENQIDNRGSKTVIAGNSAQITFSTEPKDKWPGAFFKTPEGVIWDLSGCNQVEFTITNNGSKPARIFCRVDNNNADGKKHCANADATIEAGAKKTVIVPFVTDKIWDGEVKNSGFVFSSADVKGFLVFVEQNGEEKKITLDPVKAVAAKGPTMPEWLGKKPPVDGKWTLTFEDNFDGTTLDMTKWTLPNIRENITEDTFPIEIEGEKSWWGSPSVHVAKNASVEGGFLKLKTDKPKEIPEALPKFKDIKYTTTVVTTFGKFTQKYGYFESRMKLPTTVGMWPAFWLMPDRGKDAGIWWKRQDTTNGGMEFDIMEYLVRYGAYHYNAAFHWDGYKEKHKSIGTESIYFYTDKDGFLTSGLLWEPGKITLYCNGNVVGTWKNDRIASVPEYIMYTMPIGGWGAGCNVDDSKLPAYFTVDYVRVWQKDEWK